MLKLIREVLKVGEATLPYPFQPIEIAPGFRGKPEHDPERCMACAACAIACPPNALSLTNDLNLGTRTWSLFVGRCIYCGRCEEVCPTGAITLSQNFELAVMNKDDLRERADYQLAACRQCGMVFAPRKELAYASALLEHSRLSAEARVSAQALLEICPECKRHNDVSKMLRVSQEAR